METKTKTDGKTSTVSNGVTEMQDGFLTPQYIAYSNWHNQRAYEMGVRRYGKQTKFIDKVKALFRRR
jgi:hypothetical protein